MRRFLFLFFTSGLVFQQNQQNSSALPIESFTDTTEKDIPLKSKVPLQISHSLGNVSIQGWVQDRIRVKMIKRTLANTQADAQTEFKKLEVISLETPKSFELRIGQSHGSDLVTKLQNRKQNSVSVDLEIKAPYEMDLSVLLGEQKNLSLHQWKGTISISGKNGKIEMNRLNLQKKKLEVNCQDCEISFVESQGNGHLLVGTRNVLIRKVVANENLFIDSSSGDIQLESTTGKIGIHTVSGRATSARHEGEITFQSEDGGLFVTALQGSVDANTQSGQLMIDADEVQKHLHLDSEKSDIQIIVPAKFEGILDLMSLNGEVVVQFPFESNRRLRSETYGPSTLGRVDAHVGKLENITLHAYTKKGGVRILRQGVKR